MSGGSLVRSYLTMTSWSLHPASGNRAARKQPDWIGGFRSDTWS